MKKFHILLIPNYLLFITGKSLQKLLNKKIPYSAVLSELAELPSEAWGKQAITNTATLENYDTLSHST